MSLALESGTLTVTAAKGLDRDETARKGKRIRQERCTGALQGSFYAGEELTKAELSAKLEHSVLSVNVPK